MGKCPLVPQADKETNMRRTSRNLSVFTPLSAVLLAACGGGGGAPLRIPTLDDELQSDAGPGTLTTAQLTVLAPQVETTAELMRFASEIMSTSGERASDAILIANLNASAPTVTQAGLSDTSSLNTLVDRVVLQRVEPSGPQQTQLDALLLAAKNINDELASMIANPSAYDAGHADSVLELFKVQAAEFLSSGTPMAYRFPEAAETNLAGDAWAQLALTDRLIETTAEPATENTPLVLSGFVEIADVDQRSYQFGIDGSVTNGTTVTKTTALGEFTLNQTTGAFTYTLSDDGAAANALAQGAVSNDVIQVFAEGPGGLNDRISDTLTVAVTGVNDAPVISSVSPAATVALGATANTVAGNLIAADVDSGATLTYGIQGGTAVGGNRVELAGDLGMLSINTQTGVYLYTPDPDAVDARGLLGGTSPETDTDVFTLTVTDGVISAPVTTDLTITVRGQYDAPNLLVTSSNVTENDEGGQASLQKFADINVATVDDIDQATLQSEVTLTAVNGAGLPNGISYQWNGTTIEVFIDTDALDADTPSTLPGSVTLEVRYQDTVQTQTLAVTVNDINDEAPVIVDQMIVLTEDSAPISGQITATDAENNAIRYEAGAVDSQDAFTAGGTESAGYSISGTYGTLELQANGSYTYTLNATAQTLNPADSSTPDPKDVFTLRGYDVVSGARVNNGETAELTFDITALDDDGVFSFDAGTPTENVAGDAADANSHVGVITLSDVDTALSAYTVTLDTASQTNFVIEATATAGEYLVRLNDGVTLDYENNDDRVIDITVSADDGTGPVTFNITETLADVNEDIVLAANTPTVSEDVTGGVATGQITATDPEGRAITYAFAAPTEVDQTAALYAGKTLESSTISSTLAP